MNFIKIKKNNFSSSSGFTIVEAMIAAVVISVGLIGVLTLCTMSMKLGRISLNRVIAANLAQEGIEVIRSMRDDIWLSGDLEPWDDPPFNVTGGWDDGIVFWNTLSDNWEWDITSSGYWAGARFYLDAQGRYIQYGSLPSSGAATNFWRTIEIYDDLPNARRVIVKVKWDEGNKFYEIKVEDWLYSWK
jgi:type II secretory pathway pseudopilin PulG